MPTIHRNYFFRKLVDAKDKEKSEYNKINKKPSNQQNIARPGWGRGNK